MKIGYMDSMDHTMGEMLLANGHTVVQWIDAPPWKEDHIRPDVPITRPFQPSGLRLPSQRVTGNILLVDHPQDLFQSGIQLLMANTDAPGNVGPELVSQARQLGIPWIGATLDAHLWEHQRELLSKIVDSLPVQVRRPQSHCLLKEDAEMFFAKAESEGSMWVIRLFSDGYTHDNAPDWYWRTFIPKTPHDGSAFLRSRIVRSTFEKGLPIIAERMLEGVEVDFGAFFDGVRFTGPITFGFEYKDACHRSTSGFMTNEVGGVFWADTIGCGGTRTHELLQALEPLLEHKFRGYLFGTLMLVGDDLFLLEINMRLGVPQIQWLGSIWQSDYVQDMYDLSQGKFNPMVSTEFQVGVALYMYGNPFASGLDSFSDMRILGVEEAAEECKVRLAAIRKISVTPYECALYPARNRSILLLCNGGSNSIEVARKQAYAGIEKIRCWGTTYRPDIAVQEDVMEWLTKLVGANVIPEHRIHG